MKAFFQDLYDNHLSLILLIIVIIMIVLFFSIVLSKYLEKRKERKIILQNIKNQKIYTQEEIDNIAKNVSNRETFIQTMSTPITPELETKTVTPSKKVTKRKKKQSSDIISDNVVIENTPNKEVISIDEIDKKASTKKVANSSLSKNKQTSTKKTTVAATNKTTAQTKNTTTKKLAEGQVDNEISTTKKSPSKKAVNVQVKDEIATTKKSTPTNKQPKKSSVVVNDNKGKTSYSGKWKIVQVEDKYYAELLASNGGKLLKTELYASLSGVKNGINTIKKNIDDGNFTISSDKYGHYRFKLFSKLNRLICVSDDYSSRDKCDKGIESVKRFAKSAYIILEEN